ncbi:MAG: hypothetical protein LBT78_09375 [Tannerella sp.]|jgi:hypothetical protein|nr:hypothetical protein [Tannerella sp.]
MSKVIDEQVKKTEVFISCLKKNMKLLGQLDERLISELEAENNVLNAENKEVERIKEEAREKSLEANRKLVQARRKYVELKKHVKKNTPSNKWRMVGILGGKPIFGL